MKYVYFKISAIFPDAGADKLNAFISSLPLGRFLK